MHMAELRRGLKNFGKVLAYTITGFLPSRCQNYLAEKYEWYNPDHATFTSCLTEWGAGIVLYSTSGILLSLIPFVDDICRSSIVIYKHLKKPHPTPSEGTLFLEIPALPIGKIYDKATQKSISEINTVSTLRNNSLERLLY